MSKEKEGLVSVIMPAYNSESFIKEALNSIINQIYLNWEVIVVDDCSTDNTSEIVKKYLKRDSRIKSFKLKKNSGAAVARNKGVDIAKGKYIAFLDSDDVWFPDKLRKQIEFMEQNNYTFTCTSYIKINEKGVNLGETINAKKESDYNGVLKTCPGNSTVIYNANQLGKYKIPDIKKRNDYVMWLKIIKSAGKLYGLAESLSSHRIREGSISSKKTDLVKYHWYVYRDIEQLSFLKSVYLLSYWIIKTIFRFR